MPMKVVYANVNGQLLSETRAGARKLYSLDPLGNTRALYDNTLTKTDTFEYFPSGTVAARTGTTPTPFQWVGGSGYYRDNAKRVHVRARNFYVNLGRWAETDPIGFKGGDYNLYRYVKNRFVVLIDPSGLLCRFAEGNVQCGDKSCCDYDCNDDFWTKNEKMKKHCKGGSWGECDAMSWRPKCASASPVDCPALLSFIVFAANTCDGMCSGKKYPGNANWWMATCCCKPPYHRGCNIRCCSASVPSKDYSPIEACQFECIYDHENSHLRQCTSVAGGEADECCGYITQLQCLMAKWSELNCDEYLGKPLPSVVDRCLRHSRKCRKYRSSNL